MRLLLNLPVQIVPFTEQYQHIHENLQRINGTYLHGTLQTEVGYDIFDIQHNRLPTLDLNEYYVDTRHIEKGIYPATFNGKECTLYLWKTNQIDTKGICVYNDDVEGIRFAKNHYDKNSFVI